MSIWHIQWSRVFLHRFQRLWVLWLQNRIEHSAADLWSTMWSFRKREFETPTEIISSRKACSFLHPQCLEKCLACKSWLINVGQIEEISDWPNYIFSANLNSLLFFYFLGLSLLHAQTNISQWGTARISLRNKIITSSNFSLKWPHIPKSIYPFSYLVVVFPEFLLILQRQAKETWRKLRVDSK